MLFTPLHREIGRPPGPLTNDMLDEAISSRVAETDDLDWKKSLPEAKELATSDVPKDIAAMANRGGGMIVYGVDEDEKRAKKIIGVSEVGATYERTYRAVAVRSIHPPVFNLKFHHLGDGDKRVFAVEVPASVDVPHLIYRGEYIGAPIRNDSDTVWMREPQLERLYRARLDDRRNAGHRLNQDYQHSRHQHRFNERAWLIGVARPRVTPPVIAPLEQDDARRINTDASTLGRVLADSQFSHPLSSVSLNPRPGLRRWITQPGNDSDSTKWKEAWTSVHFDGSASLAAAVGGAPNESGYDDGNVADSRRVERFVADLLALVKTVAEATGATSDYEIHIGMEYTGPEPLRLYTRARNGFTVDGPIPIQVFIPVEATVQTDVSDSSYLDQVRQIALDIVNQAGLRDVVAIVPPAIS